MGNRVSRWRAAKARLVQSLLATTNRTSVRRSGSWPNPDGAVYSGKDGNTDALFAALRARTRPSVTFVR
jgi:hypothetical protein